MTDTDHDRMLRRISDIELRRASKGTASVTIRHDDEANVWVALGHGAVSGLVAEAPTLAELFRKMADIVAEKEA